MLGSGTRQDSAEGASTAATASSSIRGQLKSFAQSLVGKQARRGGHQVRRQLSVSESPISPTAHPGPSESDMHDGQEMAEALDRVISSRVRAQPNGDPHSSSRTVLDTGRAPRSHDLVAFSDTNDYFRQRREIVRREKTLAFDYRCQVRASQKERCANDILQRVRGLDEANIYNRAPPLRGFGGQSHPRHPGDHFLTNRELIEQTDLFKIAQKMPKGGHLHIHFNSCLQPDVLLEIAAEMDRMFITSDIPLTPDNEHISFDRCEIQFSILPPEKEKPGDIFSQDYQSRQTMKFADFLERFSDHHPHLKAMEWLKKKLVFQGEETHNGCQTSAGAWQKFNGRTRMMKGLFNYERAYQEYTRKCLESFVKDNIQYAEIRPNFMKTNQLFSNDGTTLIDNVGIMEIIINEYEKFQKAGHGYFAGLKVIYCTPRSFSNELVRYALDECLTFKKRWPQWIAGFDLVGEEAAGSPLKTFVPELIEFQERCRAEDLSIPFLFHCGETLEIGGETDGNLVDALLLNTKRIGHGFALARHPYIMEHMKKRGICLETCPISNEVLGLTPRIGGHSIYNLLANNVHCTVSSDNGTLFRSTLSHDFYQVFIGQADMTLHGWRQLIEWSLDHSCLSEDELPEVRKRWTDLWDDFVVWIIETYGHVEKSE